jgi:chromosome segregation ATPase
LLHGFDAKKVVVINGIILQVYRFTPCDFIGSPLNEFQTQNQYMKRMRTTPLWLGLALALSPLALGDEVQVQNEAPAEAVQAEVQEEAPVDEAAAREQRRAEMRKRFEAMNQAVVDARAEAAAAAEQRDMAHKEAMAIREAKEQLQAQLSSLNEQLELTNNEVGQWKQKALELEKKLGAGEEAYAKLGSFRDQMDEALKEFAVLKEGLAMVRDELQAPAERVALRSEVDQLKAAGDELTAKLEAEATAHAESKEMLAARDAKMSELSAAFETLKKSAAEQLELLNQTQQERDALAKDLATAAEELANSRKESQLLKETKAEVEQELESTRNELNATKNALSTLQQEAAELRASLKPLSDGIRAAKEQTIKAGAVIQEASAARDRAENSRAKMEIQLKEVSERLAAELAAQNGLREEVASKSTEIASLRKKVEQMEAQAANLGQASDNQESAGL